MVAAKSDSIGVPNGDDRYPKRKRDQHNEPDRMPERPASGSGRGLLLMRISFLQNFRWIHFAQSTAAHFVAPEARATTESCLRTSLFRASIRSARLRPASGGHDENRLRRNFLPLLFSMRQCLRAD